MKDVKAKIEVLELYAINKEDSFLKAVCKDLKEGIAGIKPKKEIPVSHVSGIKFPVFRGLNPLIWEKVRYIRGDKSKGISKKAVLLAKNHKKLAETGIRLDYMLFRLRKAGIPLKKRDISFYEIDL